MALMCAVLAWWVPRPDPAAVVGIVRRPQASVDAMGPDAAVLAVASALCWLALLWLVLGVTLTVLAGLPGRLGTLAEALAARIVPAAIRQAIAVVVGASLVTGGVPGALTPAAWGDSGAPAAPAVDWPPQDAPGSLDWPRLPVPAPADPGGVVIVAPGDSLWLIAADRLAPGAPPGQISRAVGRWYAANRDVIGADPDLILPGQRLIAPPDQPA